MAQKRRNGDNPGEDEMTGREKKKMKMSAARKIAVQSNQHTGSSSIAVNGQSKTTNSEQAQQKEVGLAGLPSTIDVERFVEARAFEINAMHNSMKTASASSTHRVWQTLPRHLRRRAASHDVRRVPLRLRDRARAEMDVVRKKALGRNMPKRGKNNRIKPTDSFLKRQRDKIWLETHVWHAKRMHMENLWGYRLAVRPAEKAYRPSHRASIHDAILHDASYYSLIEINGPESLLKTMLDQVCDPQKAGAGSVRYLTGSRTLDTHFYRLGDYPFGLVGPATIMWKPCATGGVGQDAVILSEGNATLGNTKGKEKACVATTSLDELRRRSLWIRFHPSIHTDVLQVLKLSASQTLAAHKEQHPDAEELKVEFIDLRGHVNVFEIMGPKSSQVLKGALSPVSSDTRKEFFQFWNSLARLQSTGALPRGMIIGFKVNDPRLNFPPKNARSKTNNARSSAPNAVFPSAQLAENELWLEDIRKNLVKPRYSKKDLDDRRAKNDIPGTSLNNLRQDDRIPVVLIQRSLESNNNSEAIHGWTLMIPAGWSMAFLSSLVFTGTRVAGQRERQTQAYEAGTVYFPRDYPFTQSYEEWVKKRETEDREKWERKPPAKRVNFEELGTKDPWKANWNRVLGIADDEEKDITPEGNEQGDPAFVSTQREPMTTLPEVVTPISTGRKNQTACIQPWLLRGSELPKILSSLASVFSHAPALHAELNRLRRKRNFDPLPNNVRPADLLQGALLNVRITMCSRGAPQDMTMLYSLSDDVVKQWEKFLHIRTSKKVLVEEDTPQEMELANVVPGEEAIIGYVTTGHFSLSRGHGYGIGAIPLTRFLELEQQSLRLHPTRNPQSPPPKILVGMRNTDGMQCRAAYLQVMIAD